MKKWGSIVVVAVSTVLLAGCSLIPGAGGPKVFHTVGDLKRAYTDAGGECSGWEQDNKVKTAKQSGTCGSDVVLMVFSSKADADGTVSAQKAMFGALGNQSYELLVGQNWIVNSPDAEKVKKDLGGKIVKIGG